MTQHESRSSADGAAAGVLDVQPPGGAPGSAREGTDHASVGCRLDFVDAQLESHGGLASARVGMFRNPNMRSAESPVSEATVAAISRPASK